MLDDVGITTTFDQTLITATSSMFSFACSVGFAFLPARVGRRPLLLLSMALMWLVFTLITILTGYFTHTKSKSASYASVAFIYLYSGVHNLGWTGAMMVYVVEILPYTMRAKGISLFWLITGLAGAFNTYVNPIGLNRFGWKFYFFYVAWIAVEFAVVYWQCPETMGTSLEDVALVIEGDRAMVSKLNPVAEAVKEKEGEQKGEFKHVEATIE
jgi:MFS family permease